MVASPYASADVPHKLVEVHTLARDAFRMEAVHMIPVWWDLACNLVDSYRTTHILEDRRFLQES